MKPRGVDSRGADPVLQVDGIRWSTREKVVLSRVDLRVSAGEVVAIMGPSGSGKSTLVSLILGLIRPDAGAVTVCGIDMHTRPQATVRDVRRRHIGAVFQTGELIPYLTPVENVSVPAMLAVPDVAAPKARAEELLAELGVAASGRATGSLSGGEQQRVAIARALLLEPQLVIADEPTGALDRDNAENVGDMLVSAARARGCASLIATHSERLAARADRVLRLVDGLLVSEPIS